MAMHRRGLRPSFVSRLRRSHAPDSGTPVSFLVARSLAWAAVLSLGCSGPERSAENPFATRGSAGNSGTTASGGSAEATSDASDSGGILDLPGDSTGVEGGGDPDDPCAVAEAAGTNLGCEFWAVDLPNGWETYVSEAAEDHQFAVVVANPSNTDSALVRVHIGTTDMLVDSHQVAPGELYTFELPSQNIANDENSYDGESYRVSASNPIVAYQFNPLDNTVEVYSNDASLLIPTSGLATDYVATTGDGVQLGSGGLFQGTRNAGAFISVVGVEDDTLVTFHASEELYDGPTQDVPLSRGQVATILTTSDGGNLSGTRVTSTAPIAVYAGNVATIEPNPGDCCADHMEQQMLPLESWGNRYVVVPPPRPGASTKEVAIYRIVGGANGTQLTYDPVAPPGAPSTLDFGELAQFSTDQTFAVSSTDPDKAFSVTQFLLSTGSAGVPDDVGDPAMIVLPPVDQLEDSYGFLIPPAYDFNYLVVTRESGSSTDIDGVNLDDANWTPAASIDGQSFEFAYFELPEGAHQLQGSGPTSIVVIGYATWVSYGYPGGAGLADIYQPPPVD